MSSSKASAGKKKKKTSKPKPAARHLGPGRPTLYNKAYCEQARKLALLGLSDEQMSEVLCIASRTFYLWKQKHVAFRSAINAGRIMADAEVADALYKRATGNFSITETKVALHKGKFVQTTVEKQFEPNVDAAQFWLQKRQEKIWKDNIDVTIHAFPDKQTLDALYETIMQQANQQQAQIAQRADNNWLNEHA